MSISLENIVVKVKIKDSEKLKATVTINFGDFTVRGFRISDSQFPNTRGQNLWLQPPSYQFNGKYFPVFFIEDEEDWKELQEMIWDAYERQLATHKKEQEDSQWV